MTTLTIQSTTLYAHTAGRVVAIQRVTGQDRFNALIGQGVRESVAAAMLANLITVKVRAE
jgi:hypothetical protein